MEKLDFNEYCKLSGKGKMMKVIFIFKDEYHKENQTYDIPESVEVLQITDFKDCKEIIIDWRKNKTIDVLEAIKEIEK